MSFGVYIHLPFCQTKCNYCHFIIRPWKAETAERYCKALVREMERFFSQASWTEEADSIYLGGGTPSLVPVEHIGEILAASRRLFPVSSDCEISLECNPGTLTADKAASYRELGINRVSIGAQSFDDMGLLAIGRDHTGDQVDESVSMLRDGGIENLNIDIMLGLPSQTEERWNRDLDRTAALSPSHISVYMLDLDSKSPLYHHIAKGRCTLPDDDLISDLYLTTRGRFADHGYEQYEISNFARPGCECRHNLKYWLREPVLGFGVGSHSYDGFCRYANFSSMKAYLDAVESSNTPVEWRECVDTSQALGETLFLGLRLNRGLDWHCVRQKYDSSRLQTYESFFREMSERGLLEWKDSVVRLTPLGMLLSNEVFQKFV